MARRSAWAIFLFTMLCSASAAFGVTITLEPNFSSESITVAPDGAVIMASGTQPLIYRARKGEAQAKPFIDIGAEGKASFLGIYADGPGNTLWACQIAYTPGTTNHKSLVRSFDLQSGAPKASWPLPGDNTLCNDLTMGPDHNVYVTDTFSARIYRVRPGAPAPELLIENIRLLNVVNGIAFLDGQLYVTNSASNNIYRIPMDASGKAGDPVQIWTDQLIRGPDGMRAANGKLFIGEGRGSRAVVLTVTGEIAHVTVLQDGFTQPTGIQPAGDVVWVDDRRKDTVLSVPMPK